MSMRPWKTYYCPTCDEDVITLYRRQGRLKYAFSGPANANALNKVTSGWDVAEELATGPELLEVTCRCRVRNHTSSRVDLQTAVITAMDTQGRRLSLGLVAHNG